MRKSAIVERRKQTERELGKKKKKKKKRSTNKKWTPALRGEAEYDKRIPSRQLSTLDAYPFADQSIFLIKLDVEEVKSQIDQHRSICLFSIHINFNFSTICLNSKWIAGGAHVWYAAVRLFPIESARASFKYSTRVQFCHSSWHFFSRSYSMANSSIDCDRKRKKTSPFSPFSFFFFWFFFAIIRIKSNYIHRSKWMINELHCFPSFWFRCCCCCCCCSSDSTLISVD